jgi:hypothetical protein
MPYGMLIRSLPKGDISRFYLFQVLIDRNFRFLQFAYSLLGIAHGEMNPARVLTMTTTAFYLTTCWAT